MRAQFLFETIVVDINLYNIIVLFFTSRFGICVKGSLYFFFFFFFQSFSSLSNLCISFNFCFPVLNIQLDCMDSILSSNHFFQSRIDLKLESNILFLPHKRLNELIGFYSFGCLKNKTKKRK